MDFFLRSSIAKFYLSSDLKTGRRTFYGANLGASVYIGGPFDELSSYGSLHSRLFARSLLVSLVTRRIARVDQGLSPGS